MAGGSLKRHIEPPLPEEWHGDRRMPWDRLDNETVLEYELFWGYCQMGRERSLRRLSAATGDSTGRLAPISAKHSWVARVEVWDVEQQRIALASLEGDQVAMRERHARIAAALLEKAEAAVANQDPRFIHARDVPIWLDVAAKLERLSKGVTETKRVEVTGKDGGPITVAAELSPEARRELLSQAHAELSRRLGQAAAIEEAYEEAEVVEDE